MRKVVIAQDSIIKDVITKQRSIDYEVCPHCGDEVREKSTYIPDVSNMSVSVHRPCGGSISYPDTPAKKEQRELFEKQFGIKL